MKSRKLLYWLYPPTLILLAFITAYLGASFLPVLGLTLWVLFLLWQVTKQQASFAQKMARLNAEKNNLESRLEQHQSALEDAQLIAQTKDFIIQNELDRSAKLEEIRVMGNCLSSAPNLKELQNISANCLKEFLSAYTGALYFWDETQSKWDLASTWGDYSSEIYQDIKADELWLTTSGQAYYDSTNDQKLNTNELAEDTDKQITCYPIFYQNHRFGVLHVRSDNHVEQQLNAEDQKLLMDFCKTLGLHFYNAKLLSELSMDSNRDALTGLLNRRGLDSTLKREIKAAVLQGYSVSIAMMDIDHFKQYNDTYGHQQGDQALQFVADTLAEQIRARDVLARYGGEEFMLILPKTSKKEALQKLRSLIKRVEQASNQSNRCKRTITLSVGLATSPEDHKGENELVRQADAALYAAKHQGRNRVVPHTAKKSYLTASKASQLKT